MLNKKFYSCYLVALTCLVGVCLASVNVALAQTSPATSAMERLKRLDLTSTLPSKDEAKEFTIRKTEAQSVVTPSAVVSGRKGVRVVKTGLFAERPSDNMTLMVDVGVSPTPAEAQEIAQRAIETQGAPLPEGVASGRRIGQRVWSQAYPDKVARGAFKLVAYDNKTVVIVKLITSITEQKDGKPVMPIISPEDLRLAEDIALRRLSLIAEMGYATKAKTTN